MDHHRPRMTLDYDYMNTRQMNGMHGVLWEYSVDGVIPLSPVGVDGVLFKAVAAAILNLISCMSF